MSGVQGAVRESELHARIDGQLPPDRAEAVVGFLAAHPEEQQRWAYYADQRDRLRAAFAAPADEPIPARLRVARLQTETRRRWHRRFAEIAAGVALLVLGGIGGWTAQNLSMAWSSSSKSGQAEQTARTITADALAAYRIYSVDVRHPVEVAASQETQLVQWLSKRLGRTLVVPDLATTGFQLIGGRLLPARNGPAAQFMYQNAEGKRLELYLRSGIGGETAFRYLEDGGIGAFYWSDQGFGYAVVAKTDRILLLRISEIVYRQTDPDGGKAKLPPLPGKAG